MGTRNLTIVIDKKEIKVAQYCQWDGYPSGQGEIVSEFLQSSSNLKKLRSAIPKCSFLPDEEINKLTEECGPSHDGWVGLDVSDAIEKRYPEFHRNTGGLILDLIANHKVRKLADSRTFAGDSLFCEWLYCIDLDNDVLEVYMGFNKKNLTKKDRFFGYASEGKYKPVKLFAKIEFSELTPDTMTELQEKANKKN